MNRRSATVLDALNSLETSAPGPARSGVLATLVHTEGSAYQKAGARLYISPADAVYGLVSGGCLEQAIVDEAWALRSSSTAAARLLSYDTSDPSDLDFGFGLGCGGKLWVFFETIRDKAELLGKIRGTAPRGSTEAIVVAAADPERLGQRFFFDAESLSAEKNQDVFPEGPLSRSLRELGPGILEHRGPRSQLLGLDGMTVALLQRPAETQLTIFGAGPGAWPLAALAQTLGWAVRVMDHRPAYLEDFPSDLAQKVELPRAEIPALSFYPEAYQRAAAVVMTHNFEVDQLLMAKLCTEPWTYIGLLGSNKRCQKLLGLGEGSKRLNEAEARKIYAPAGLTLGGDDVQSIALALIAEIQAVSSGQSHPTFRRESYGTSEK